MLVKLINVLICSIVFVFSCNAQYFVFVNPSNKADPFWNYATKLAIATASDLNIKLEVAYSDANRIHQSDLISEIAKRREKPTAVIFLPYDGSIMRSFSALEEANIPFVTLEQVFNRQMFPTLGRAMENYSNWLGEYNYNNQKAAVELTSYLVHQANIKLADNSRIFSIGIGGDFYQSSIKRMEGFSMVVHANKNVVLNHVLPAGWQREKAKDLFHQLHRKYSKTNLVFCASDQMALGVIEAAKEYNLAFNKEFFVGGFDWFPETLVAIKNDEFTASMGGHYILVSKAIIDLYDHFKGISPYTKGSTEYRVPLSIIHKDNIAMYLPLLVPFENTSIDFTIFSKHKTKRQNRKYVPYTALNFANNLKLKN